MQYQGNPGATHWDGYNAKTNAYHARYRPDSSELLTRAIVRSVATVTCERPTALDPLYEVIDPDSLFQLFASGSGRSDHVNDRLVEFEFCGCVVTVTANEVTVCPVDALELV